MRSSIAIALAAAALCAASALPAQAASKTRTIYATTGFSNQVCWPSAINPVLMVCGPGAGPGYNTVAYGNMPAPMGSKNGSHSCGGYGYGGSAE